MKLGLRSTTFAGLELFMADLRGVDAVAVLVGGGVVAVFVASMGTVRVCFGCSGSGSRGRKPWENAGCLNRYSLMSVSLYSDTKALSLMAEVIVSPWWWV